MSRVDKMSRCDQQLAYRVIASIDLSDSVSAREKEEVRATFVDPKIREAEDTSDAFYAGALEMEGCVFDDPACVEAGLKHELLQAFEQAFKAGLGKKDLDSIGRITADILLQSDEIWCDVSAVNHFMLHAQTGRFKVTPHGPSIRRLRNSLAAATSIAEFGMIATQQGHAERSLLKVCQERLDVPAYRGIWLMAEACEKLMLGGYPGHVREAHERLKAYDPELKASDFEVDNSLFQAVFTGMKVWRLLGATYVLHEKVMYLFEHSTLESLRSRMRYWDKNEQYWRLYRVLGHCGTSQGDVLKAFHDLKGRLFGFMHEDLVAGRWFNWRFYPQSMKKYLAVLQNEVHKAAERLDVGAESRHRMLLEEAGGYVSMNWYEEVKALDVSDRAKLDLAYMYHCFPAPDIDPQVMFVKTMKKMEEDTPHDPAEFARFLNYVRMHTLALTAVRERKVPKYVEEPGYNLEERKWFKRCLSGKLTIPPSDEWGKAELRGHFKSEDTLSTWSENCQDVTHVVADPSLYSSTSSVQRIDRAVWNELTYCLKYGSLLSYKYSPEQVRAAADAGRRPGIPVAVMAAKAENTKPEANARETFSHDDITRELNTQIDHAIHQMCKMNPGPSLRRGPAELERTFHEVVRKTAPQYQGLEVNASIDLVGWSPCVDRKVMLAHHRLLIGMTDLGPGWDLEVYWKDIVIAIIKRGVAMSQVQNHGTFQGWTPACDTLYHAHMIGYIIRTAKDKKLLKESEAANSLCLIDDALISVPLDRSQAEAQAVADAFYGHVVSTYLALGFKVEVSKTIYSSINCIYLNRHFVGGSEVCCASKVFGKADREFERRFATLHDQFRAVLNSHSAAVTKGSDPLVCYYCALQRICDLWMQSAGDKFTRSAEPLCAAAFSPTQMGGMSLPTFGAFLTKECPDRLSAFVWAMQQRASLAVDRVEKLSWLGWLARVVYQPTRCPSLGSFMRDAGAVHSAGVPDAVGPVGREIAKALHRASTAKQFKDAFALYAAGDNPELVEVVMHEYQWDPRLLAEFAECTPAAAVDALISRCVKNESLAFLIPYRRRQKLGAEVRRLCKSVAVWTFSLPEQEFEPADLMDSHVAVVMEIRQDYFAEHNLHVVNATTPDPFAVLARQRYPVYAYIKVHAACFLPPTQDSYASVWGSKRDSYLNFYDAHCGGNKLYPRRSAGIFDANEADFRTLSHTRKAVVRAAALYQYIKENGLRAENFWLLFGAFWGCTDPLQVPLVERHIAASTSAKRLGPTVRTHPLSAFPNTQSCLSVNTQLARRFYDSSRTNSDLAAETTAAWTIGVVGSAAYGRPIPELAYNQRPGCVVLYDDQIFLNISLHPLVIDTIAAPIDLSEKVRRAMVDWQVKVTDEDVLGKMLEDEFDSVDIIRSVKFSSFRGGVVALGSTLPPPPVPRVGAMNVARPRPTGDLTEPRFVATIRQKVRKWEQQVEPGAAYVAGVCAQLAAYAGRKVPKLAYTSSWRERDEVAKAALKQPCEKLKSAIVSFRGSLGSVGMDVLKACLPLASHVQLRYLRTGASFDLPEQEALLLAGELYLLYHGRCQSPEAYRSLALMGPDRLTPCYRFASKRHGLLSRSAGHHEKILHLVLRHLYQAASQASLIYRTDSDMWALLLTGVVAGAAAAAGIEEAVIDPSALSDRHPRDAAGARAAVKEILDAYQLVITIVYSGRLASDLNNVFTDLAVAYKARRLGRAVFTYRDLDAPGRPVVGAGGTSLFHATAAPELPVLAVVEVLEPRADTSAASAGKKERPAWLTQATALRVAGYEYHASEVAKAKAVNEELADLVAGIEITTDDVEEAQAEFRSQGRTADLI